LYRLGKGGGRSAGPSEARRWKEIKNNTQMTKCGEWKEFGRTKAMRSAVTGNFTGPDPTPEQKTWGVGESKG